jgi:hypothetical protein
MDAIQIGKQRAFATRLWKGFWYEDLIYSEIKNDFARQRIYEYFAMRYQVWSENAAGQKIFPFASNRTRSLEQDIENYKSTPYNGDPKALVRGGVEGDYELIFGLREQAEYRAAQAFFQQHRPTTKFVFRDYRFCPVQAVRALFTSAIREQGSDVTFRFNYGFTIHTDDVTVPEVDPIVILPAVPTGLRLTVLSDSSILAEWDAPPDTTPPSVPTMNAPTVVSDTEIDFSWTAATDDVGVTGYDLEVATNAGFTTGLVTHNLGNVTSFPATALTGSTTYYARVRAHDAVPNNSAYSSSVNATTNTPTTSKWQTPPPTDWVLNGDYSREATAATFASATNIVAPRIAAIGDYIEVKVVSIGGSGGGVGGWFAEDSLGKLITISSSGVMSSTDVGDQYLTTGWTVGDTLRIEKTGATQLTITKVGVEFQVMNQIMTGNVEIRWGGLTATGVKLANPVTNI